MNVVLDLSAGSQSYIEDCQVCCEPIQVSFETEEGVVTDLQVDRA
jgi:hypothetical protein